MSLEQQLADVTDAANMSATATRLLRVYTNGVGWCVRGAAVRTEVWSCGTAAVGDHGAHADVTRPRSIAPLALVWTSQVGSPTGHAWPGPMEALGGMDGTDAALSFFAQQGIATPQVSSSDAFQPLLAQMSACKTVAPDGLPPLLGLSAGPCSDLQGAASNAWLS